MTAEVDVHDSSEVCGSEIAKGDVAEEQCGFDMSSYNDMANGSSNCNGNSHCGDDTINEVDGISKDDSDGSYIFVNGNDAKDDVVDDDLVGKPIGDMSVENEVSELKVEHLETQLDGELGDKGVAKVQNGEAEQTGTNGEFKAIGDMSVETGVSELKVEHGETLLEGELGDTGVEEVQNVEAQQPGTNGEFKATENVVGTGGSQVTHKSAAYDCESTNPENGKVEIEAEEEEDHADNQIALKSYDESHTPGGRDGGEITERESKSESVKCEIECKRFEIAIEEDIENAQNLEKEQMVYSSEGAMEGSSVVQVGGDDLQKDYVSALSPNAKTKIEAASGKVHVTIENTDSLPASLEKGVLSESLDTCQNPDEPTGSSENIESLASPVMLGDAASANDQVSTTGTDDDKSGSTNNVPIEGNSGDREMDFETSSKAYSCSEVDATLETEVDKDSNGPISDESVNSLPTGLEQGSIPEGPSGDKKMDFESSSKSSPCSEVDATLETEVDKDSNGPISDETGDSIPTGLEQGSIPKTVGEQKVCSENSESLAFSSAHDGPSGDKEMDFESSSKSSPCSVVDATLETEVDKDSNGRISNETRNSIPTGLEQGSIPEIAAEQNACSEKPESLKSSSAHDGPSGNKEMDFELSLKSSPCSEVDATLETEVDKDSNAPISDEKGDSIPTVLEQGSIPETVAEQNICSEKSESLTSSSAHDIVNADNGQNAPVALINCRMMKSDVGSVVSLSAENLSTCKVEDMIAKADTGKSVEECSENSEACLIDCKKVAVETENGSFSNDTIQTCPVHAEKSEPKACLVSLEDVEDEVHVSSDAMDGDSSISNMEAECAGSHDTSGAHADVEIDIVPSVEDEHYTSACVDVVKPESEVHHTSAVSRDILDNDIAPESNILNSDSLYTGSAVDRDLNAESKGSKSSPEGVVHVESSVKLNCQGAENVDEIDKDETSKSFPENAVEGENMSPEVVKRALCFLIRMPRYDDENIREQIKQAQVQVEEKTKIRDDVRVKIQRKREACKDYDDIFQGAASKERAARDLLKSKRQEMDSVQFMINKVKNAMSVEDLDGQIRSMEHMIEHETLPLKKEKELIRDINKLKQTREHIFSNMGKQDEVQQAVDQKDQIEERLKSLRKDLDLLRDNLLKAEEVTQAAKKKLNVEKDELNELFSNFKAADSIRQGAYVHLQSLKKRLYEKNKSFWKYKEDAKTAYDLALSGDREQLQRLCADQVETTMELWNKNDDFRKEYIRCNTRSTLRRLRTLDGRSLCPDEEPPVIPNNANERFNKNNSAAQISTTAQEKEVMLPAAAQISPTAQEKKVILPEIEKSVDKLAEKMVEKNNQTAKAKKPAKVASSMNDSATLSSRDDNEEEKEEEHKRTKEEENLVRKAEEQRKEEETARLKEQRKLEEKAKAKEALERKKRIAEKAQARAAIRAQKETEEKERERERRAKKKEKKANATARGATTDVGEGESVPSPNEEIPSGTPKEPASVEKPTTVTRRTQKTSQFTKQSKSKSIPPPIRNRGKRRIQPWMWVLLTVVVVFVLFLVGNASFSFKSTLQEFGF